MTEYYHIVPWYNSNEWHKVYDKIYSGTSSFVTKQEALNLLLIWKARCPSLPSGIESTLTLLEVYIQDIKNPDAFNDQLIRLAYSSAIMRFVNHMLDTETAKGTSLYQAAKNLGVPEWIVDLRHDTAHNNNLPSIELLREAALFGLEWLQQKYWDKHKECIKDYISGQKEADSNDRNKIAAVMNFCISLSICAHSKCKIKNLSEIPNASMRESIVNDCRALFGDHIDLSNLKTVSVMGLINLLTAHSKRLLKSKDVSSHVNKALLGADSQFLSLELLNFLSPNNWNVLSKHYVQCFEVLLTYLHSNELILDFILELVKVTQNSDDNKKCHLAALWLSEILKALNKSKNFIERMKKVNSDDINTKTKKELKSLFHHWFPNEKKYGLLLDMRKPVPLELTNINFIQPIISAYNPYLTHFIKDLLSLVEPKLPKANIVLICKLAKSISFPDQFPVTSSRIYTVEDLKSYEGVPSSVERSNDEDSDCIEVCDESMNVDEELQPQIEMSKWQLASNEHLWAACPIGQLPWQCMDSVVQMET